MPRINSLKFYHSVRYAGWALGAVFLGGAVFAEEVNFAKQIRPILNSRCAHCHGPDEGNRQGDFRVDSRAGVLADLGGRRGFEPGKPQESEALRRMVSSDPADQMPPPDSGHTLTAEEIDLVRKWVAEGADWSEHWAFIAPRRPTVPQVADPTWVRNPIDAFVLSRLEEEGLRPSPPAKKSTLLRRLTLDLIGLPPRAEELDAFLEDADEESYPRQVERLLRSPHYGERWARIWLDAARYADSDGFEKDKPRNVWMYRDWVIDAHNRDLPYDEFIIAQIAGDLLPNADQNQIIATGFLRNSMLNEEGGVDPEQFRMEAMFDRMDAIGKAVLGLTLQCGQCHNHKYDPLTQTDYYRMFALLNNSFEATMTVYPAGKRAQREGILQEIESVEVRLKHAAPDWRQRLLAWAETATQQRPSWTVLSVANAGDNSQRYEAYADASLLAQGYAPTKHDARFRVETPLPEIRAFRVEAMTDPNLPAGGPGRSVEGLFALTEFKVEVASAATPDKTEWVQFTRAAADFANSEQTLSLQYSDKEGKRGRTGPVDFAIDGDEETAWGIDAGPGRRNLPRQAVFVADRDFAQPGGTVLTFHFVQKHGGWNSDDNQNLNLGRFRVSASGDVEPQSSLLPLAVDVLMDRPAEQWSDADWQVMFGHWRTLVPQWRAANDKIESLWQQHPAGTTQLVYAERNQMRPTYRLNRGDFLQPTEAVEPGVPAFLNPIHTSSPSRLDLARWLVARDSPTTARAIVNRIWQAYFGTGLVATSEDFGLQGELPSHSDLLDWLAVELMENDWSPKHLHRLIARSNTYRQDSRATPELLARDPANRLFARGARYRVDAEIIRDISLAASGLLNPTVGGPSVYPPAPEFLFQPPASYGPKTWEYDLGSDKYRRALYTFRFRSTPYPALQVFDAPNGDTACVRRVRSNTPLQALTTLNEPLFVECAQALAMRTLIDGGSTDEGRAVYAVRRCVGRIPRQPEVEVLMKLLDKTKQQLAGDTTAVTDLVSQMSQNAARPAGVADLDLAAWSLLCRVVLNLDETLTRE